MCGIAGILLTPERSRALIIVSASGQENVRQENVRQENGKSSIFLSYIFLSYIFLPYIFLSYIFLSAGLDGRNDDQGPVTTSR